MEAIAEKYINPNELGAFTNPCNFERLHSVDVGKVKRSLKGVNAYRLHFPVPRRFKRRPYIYTGIDEIWAMDLAAVPYPKSNYNKHWILCCVDGLSKMGFLEALKSKHASEVIQGFQNIMERTGRHPRKLEFDEAKEFLSIKMKTFGKDNGIETFTIKSKQKIATIERFIETVFRIIERYKTQRNTKRFVHKLHLFENIYNHSYHRSIKMEPASVNKSNEMEVFDELYRKHYKKEKQKKLTLNSKVLIKVDKRLFQKGRSSTFHPHEHTVYKVNNTSPPTYLLRNNDGVELNRPYYGPELFSL